MATNNRFQSCFSFSYSLGTYCLRFAIHFKSFGVGGSTNIELGDNTDGFRVYGLALGLEVVGW